MNDHNPSSDSDDQPTGPTERMTEGDPLSAGPDRPDSETDDAPGAPQAGEPGGAPGAESEPTETMGGGWIPPGGGYSPRASGGAESSSAGASPLGEGPARPTATVEEPRRLRRSSRDRLIGGVAGGLGRYFDVDPVLFRIAFIVLTFA